MAVGWSNQWNVSSGVTVEAGTWYHVANTYDSNTAKIYVNGEIKVSQSVSKFQLVDQNQTAWLATDKGESFQSACVMDEEVQNIMKHGIYEAAYAVEPSEKLTVLWGKLKR